MDRQALSFNTFTTELLPPVLCYYATAVLILLPRTLPIRLALWPITVLAAFRASTQLDLSAGWPCEERLIYLNQGLLVCFYSCLFTLTHVSLDSHDHTRHACFYLDLPARALPTLQTKQ